MPCNSEEDGWPSHDRLVVRKAGRSSDIESSLYPPLPADVERLSLTPGGDTTQKEAAFQRKEDSPQSQPPQTTGI